MLVLGMPGFSCVLAIWHSFCNVVVVVVVVDTVGDKCLLEKHIVTVKEVCRT
ncbi:hypothetical protein KIN20_019390 [Parelaphostrongylus tenuis]|uniref:Uncharacterized protein n=1 Tax=Parelaphostrongylus tenuis TaxID=148309 RepID=A0AAD5N263_PARTN|nr:hypothetical protein KIN20_019390 [Parelaphostrongylus tenuis]